MAAPPRRPRRSPRRRRQTASYGPLLDAAKQPLRPQQDHRDEDQKWKGAAILRREVSRRKVVEDAEDDAAQDRAAHLIETPDDGGGERREPERLAIGEFRQIDRADEYRGDGDEHGVDEKCKEHHAFDWDAEDARQDRILRRRLH